MHLQLLWISWLWLLLCAVQTLSLLDCSLYTQYYQCHHQSCVSPVLVLYLRAQSFSVMREMLFQNNSALWWRMLRWIEAITQLYWYCSYNTTVCLLFIFSNLKHLEFFSLLFCCTCLFMGHSKVNRLLRKLSVSMILSDCVFSYSDNDCVCYRL